MTSYIKGRKGIGWNGSSHHKADVAYIQPWDDCPSGDSDRLQASKTIDATGLIVSPGFIDSARTHQATWRVCPMPKAM